MHPLVTSVRTKSYTSLVFVIFLLTVGQISTIDRRTADVRRYLCQLVRKLRWPCIFSQDYDNRFDKIPIHLPTIIYTLLDNKVWNLASEIDVKLIHGAFDPFKSPLWTPLTLLKYYFKNDDKQTNDRPRVQAIWNFESDFPTILALCATVSGQPTPSRANFNRALIALVESPVSPLFGLSARRCQRGRWQRRIKDHGYHSRNVGPVAVFGLPSEIRPRLLIFPRNGERIHGVISSVESEDNNDLSFIGHLLVNRSRCEYTRTDRWEVGSLLFLQICMYSRLD
ncbi:hypothetical protein WA026_005904 [Henosepilachna vigintioctopunctata]|uniref:Uncharacterized protein n=1 Tax=Henosepilachna vigintioctopunctata TaxID=420089 RepID=A0AAW1TXV6_9CUCU